MQAAAAASKWLDYLVERAGLKRDREEEPDDLEDPGFIEIVTPPKKKRRFAFDPPDPVLESSFTNEICTLLVGPTPETLKTSTVHLNVLGELSPHIPSYDPQHLLYQNHRNNEPPPLENILQCTITRTDKFIPGTVIRILDVHPDAGELFLEFVYGKGGLWQDRGQLESVRGLYFYVEIYRLTTLLAKDNPLRVSLQDGAIESIRALVPEDTPERRVAVFLQLAAQFKKLPRWDRAEREIVGHLAKYWNDYRGAFRALNRESEETWCSDVDDLVKEHGELMGHVMMHKRLKC